MSLSEKLKRWVFRVGGAASEDAAPSDLVYVKNYETRLEAEMAKGYLGSHDIPSIVSVEDMGGARPILGGVTGGARLIVQRADAERAGLLLDGVTDDFPRDGRAG